MSAKFELKKNAGGAYYFHLKAANGEIVLRSQSYGAKASALKGIESVKANAGTPTQYVKSIAKNGQPYFNLTATNGQVIGTSETYSGEAACDNGIQSVMANAPSAEIEDLISD